MQFLKAWAMTLFNACFLLFVLLPVHAFRKLAPQPVQKR